jgi:hypothetical protein
MSAFTPDTAPPRPDLAARHAIRLDACWPRVCVESAQVTAGVTGECARVLVQLGGLTPADVRVELTPLCREEPDAAAHAEHRMFSSQSYHNGCFVFETRLPAYEAALQEWLVLVHPSEAVDEPRVEHRFRGAAAEQR